MRYNNTANYGKIKLNSENTLTVDVNLLTSLLSISSPSGNEHKMSDFINRYIVKNFGDTVLVEEDTLGNLYITKGELNDEEFYPCIVAHMDEVHSYNPDRRIARIDNFIIGWDIKEGEQVGTGADDKNGIYIALTMLHHIEKIKLFFPVKEEVGCVGSNGCDMDWFKDVGYLMQPDRRGYDDLIVHTNGVHVCSGDFIADNEDILLTYEYSEEYGTCTDIGTLVCNGVGVSACNISCGYFEEHSSEEKIYLPALANCLNLIYKILINSGLKRYEHTVSKKGYSIYSRDYDSSWDKYYYNDYYDEEELESMRNYYSQEESINDIIEDYPCAKCKDQDCMRCTKWDNY